MLPIAVRILDPLVSLIVVGIIGVALSINMALHLSDLFRLIANLIRKPFQVGLFIGDDSNGRRANIQTNNPRLTTFFGLR